MMGKYKLSVGVGNKELVDLVVDTDNAKETVKNAEKHLQKSENYRKAKRILDADSPKKVFDNAEKELLESDKVYKADDYLKSNVDTKLGELADETEDYFRCQYLKYDTENTISKIAANLFGNSGGKFDTQDDSTFFCCSDASTTCTTATDGRSIPGSIMTASLMDGDVSDDEITINSFLPSPDEENGETKQICISSSNECKDLGGRQMKSQEMTNKMCLGNMCGVGSFLSFAASDRETRQKKAITLKDQNNVTNALMCIFRLGLFLHTIQVLNARRDGKNETAVNTDDDLTITARDTLSNPSNGKNWFCNLGDTLCT